MPDYEVDVTGPDKSTTKLTVSTPDTSATSANGGLKLTNATAISLSSASSGVQDAVINAGLNATQQHTAAEVATSGSPSGLNAGAEAKRKANAEAKTKANAEAKTKANAEAKAKANAEAKTKANAEAAKGLSTLSGTSPELHSPSTVNASQINPLASLVSAKTPSVGTTSVGTASSKQPKKTKQKPATVAEQQAAAAAANPFHTPGHGGSRRTLRKKHTLRKQRKHSKHQKHRKHSKKNKQRK